MPIERPHDLENASEMRRPVDVGRRNYPLPPLGETTFFIVDDHPVVTFALRELIASQPGWRVVAQAASPRDALEALAAHRPAMMILDLLFPAQSGLDSLSRLRDALPGMHITVYTVQPPEVYGIRCLNAGARGYVRKDAPVELFLRALRVVAAGGRWLGDRAWAGSDDLARKIATKQGALSPRELEVLELLAQGLTSREMAASLCRSVKTIETHRHRLSRKLGLRTGAELMRYAIHHLEGAATGGGGAPRDGDQKSPGRVPGGAQARKDRQ